MPAIITAYQNGVTPWNDDELNAPLLLLDKYTAFHHNCMVHCDGTLTYNKSTGKLTWSGSIRVIFNNSSGNAVANYCSATNITIADNQFAYLDLNETDGTAIIMGVATVTTATASNFLTPYRLVLGYRNSTTDEFYPLHLQQSFSAAGVFNNFTATTAPTTGDDIADGYSVGSRWINTSTDIVYTCVDNTSSAAIWVRTNNLLNKTDATTNPTADDDSGDGYEIGSKWINVTDDLAFICLDNTSTAAVWEQINNANEINPWEIITTNTNAVSGHGYLINASGGAVTLTLPASPSVGDNVKFSDYYDQATTNTITIARNSSNINGTASDLVLSTNGEGGMLVYGDSTIGWKLVASV